MLNIDKSKFNEEQLFVINNCIKNGDDPTLILNPLYSPGVMRLILAGLDEGLDVTCYTNPNLDEQTVETIYYGLRINPVMSEYVKQGFTPEQLVVLCDCMQEGITDFSIIANKDYPPEVMKICEYIILYDLSLTKDLADKIASEEIDGVLLNFVSTDREEDSLRYLILKENLE